MITKKDIENIIELHKLGKSVEEIMFSLDLVYEEEEDEEDEEEDDN